MTHESRLRGKLKSCRAPLLGSHLVDELIARGARVVALDSFVTESSSNLDNLRDNPNLMLIQWVPPFFAYPVEYLSHWFDSHDVREPFPIPSDEIDGTYHLSYPASPPQYQKDPIKTLDTCYLGTRNTLEFAIHSKARFLLASMSGMPIFPSLRSRLCPCVSDLI